MGEEDSFEKDFEWALKNGDIDQVKMSVNKVLFDTLEGKNSNPRPYPSPTLDSDSHSVSRLCLCL